MSKVTNNKNEVWKSVRLTRFQKRQLLQSVSIFFKFVLPCLLLYLLCYLYVILKFWAVIFVYNSSLWQFCLNFDKLCDTAPSKSSQNWLTPILKVEFHISYFLFSLLLLVKRYQIWMGVFLISAKGHISLANWVAMANITDWLIITILVKTINYNKTILN